MPTQDRTHVNLCVSGKTLNVHTSYNYCAICGHVPRAGDEPNYAPIRFWDPDDGWKIGALCRWCAEEVINDKPEPGDFAFYHQETIDDSGTDEDPLLAFKGY